MTRSRVDWPKFFTWLLVLVAAAATFYGLATAVVALVQWSAR